ncbi:hypothetical protein D0Z08_01640 [Nocardioides immobilis]|uniref:Uncharacterized protein n=1 Tax=Nocardioides immobilis TaxID=2049295 RepID=A0A417Y809_9ACTN|nr:hypothetical protein [Nocardioides immobilis]RHW28594.1 hypothetical protein D0Z08_01640 [Nocardioides immobilis]
MADKDIDAPDWIDQDLLTRDEAGERLDEEIESARRRVAELESSVPDQRTADSLEMVRRRLAAMENVRASL